MPWDDIDGRWDRLPYDDPRATAETEQLRAEALDCVRNGRTFAVLSIGGDSTPSVRTVSVIAASMEYDPTGEDENCDDTSRLEMAMCETLVRSYFDSIPNSEEASLLDIIAVAAHHRQLIGNVIAVIERVLIEKGYVV